MVLIHKQTFDILKSIPDESELENYFSCDEEIAPVISLLNKKGYTTTFCCSGHLYDEITDTLIIDDPEATEESIRDTFPGVIRMKKVLTDPEEGTYGFQVTLRQNLGMQTYITFEKDIELPSIPDKFFQRGSTILHNYYWDDTFDHPYPEKELQEKAPYLFYKRRLEILSGLYAWAEELPVRKTEDD